MHCFRGVVLALALLGDVCCHAGVSANEGGTDPSFEITAEQPQFEIHRVGGTVELHEHLVTGAASLDRPRELTFYLQATPAKPMPEEPVSWRRWWTPADGGDMDNVVTYNMWGNNWYWGARYQVVDWKIAFFGGFDDGVLFNLADDPRELRNLWNEPAAQSRKAELLARLVQRLAQTDRFDTRRYCGA